jgi:hypothetical protein
MRCGMAKAIIMSMHIQQEQGKRLHNKGVYYQSKAACRSEREKDCQQLPVVVFWLPPPAVM